MRVYTGSASVECDGATTQGSGVGPVRVYTEGATVEVRDVPSGALHYSDGMQPFEVRALSGAYAPAGALTFMRSQPAPWNQTGGAWGARGQIEAWTGGCADGSRVLFAGGGHQGSDGMNNGVHCFDFAQDADGRPVGFSTLPGSRVPTAVAQADLTAAGDVTALYANSGGRFSDGSPLGQHIYSLMAYSPVTRNVIRGRTLFNWFNETSQQYTIPDLDLSAMPEGKRLTNSGSTMMLSPDGAVAFLLTPYGSVPNFVDLKTGVVKPIGKCLYPWSSSSAGDAHSCHDTKRNRWIVINGYSKWVSVHFVSIDWAARTWSAVAVSSAAVPSGTVLNDMPLCGGMGIVYDAALDCFWAFSHKYEAETGSFNRVVKINAQTGAIVATHALSAPIVTRSKGQYGRCMIDVARRFIGVIPHFDQPASIIRLPGAPTTPPAPGGGDEPQQPDPEPEPAPPAEPPAEPPAPSTEPPTPPAGWSDPDWTARSTGPGVLLAHAFADARELTSFERSPNRANRMQRVDTDIGPAILGTTYGTTLVDAVPECPAYCVNKTPAGAAAARQVWRIANVDHLPPGALPYSLYVGKGGTCTERVTVEAIDRSASTITVVRRISSESMKVDGVVYPGGSDAKVAPAYPGDGSVSLGLDTEGMWVRPLAALRAAGLPDDIGLSNGAARKLRTWPPQGASGSRPHLWWREGYWGHRSYWDPEHGAAEFRDWLPLDNDGKKYKRTDCFEGDDLWIQFRCRFDAARLAVGAPVNKVLFLQNDVAGSGQLFWTAGGPKTKRPGDFRPLPGRGSVLVPCTCYADSAAQHGGLLTVPQSGGFGDGTAWQDADEWPECRWQGYSETASAECWRFPADKWVTYMLHMRFGRDNSPQPYTGWQAFRDFPGPWPADLYPEYRTTLQLWVAEDGDDQWTTITDYDKFRWVFGDQKYEAGHYEFNPPGLNALWLGATSNLYLGSGSVAPPRWPTSAEFAQVIVSRNPIPMPRTGKLPRQLETAV